MKFSWDFHQIFITVLTKWLLFYFKKKFLNGYLQCNIYKVKSNILGRKLQGRIQDPVKSRYLFLQNTLS